MAELSLFFITVVLLMSTMGGIMLIGKRREPMTHGVMAVSFLVNALIWLAALHLYLT
jgi:hypothetical protein